MPKDARWPVLPRLPWSAWAVVAACLLLAACAAAYAWRERIPAHWQAPLRAVLFNVRVDHAAWITMPDGVRLAGSLYLPRRLHGRVGTLYIALPYDRRRHGAALSVALFYARHGYAVLLQDVRSKFESEGADFLPWRHATRDGAATLDWITRQPWSNGKVGTFGCSALGELQYALARANHPAHVAMVPIAAGGAVGTADGRGEYFGMFEGGVFQLASGVGWFTQHGAADPRAPAARAFEPGALLRELPVSGLVQRARPGANGYAAYLAMPLGSTAWNDLDLVSAGDRIAVPALVVNTWGDQTVSGTLSLAERVRQAPGAAVPQHVVIGPGDHCQEEATAVSGVFGDLVVRNARQPYREWYLQWFEYWLHGRGEGLARLPPYLYFVLGEDRWLSATQWPPAGTTTQRWYLDSGGHANSRDGDGRLATAVPALEASDGYRHDPMDPVPSRGGPVCCTGDPAMRSGPVDQHDVEVRDDVLVYTSSPLPRALRIVGPLDARLVISSSAPDTDVIARLVHVRPDGLATTIQEGALRARYRGGLSTPRLMPRGQRQVLDVSMRDIAYLVPAGHRLRLVVASSSFPRLERNLGNGGDNAGDAVPRIAHNRVHHGGDALSYLALPVLADGAIALPRASTAAPR